MKSKEQGTRKKILSAATQTFKKKGYSGAGVREIMKNAGLTIGGFYSYFKSKEDLLCQVLQETLKEYREQTDEKLANKNGLAWLNVFIELYLGESHRDSLDRGCSLPSLIGDLPRIGGKSRMKFEGEFKLTLSRLGSHFSQPPEASAIALLALCLGGLSLARGVKDKEFSNEILRSCREVAKLWAKNQTGEKNENRR